jgi:2-oxoisovalerate dehydrogenase E1 component
MAGPIEGVEDEQALALYRVMSLIRQADDHVRRQIGSGQVQMSYWPVEGQEAVSAGAMAALRPDDRLVSTYRGLGDVLAKGIDLEAYFSELLGKETGLSKGKAGAMGVSDRKCGVAWSTGIVGAGPLIADGLALASKLRSDDAVALVSFGDGATSIGYVHEAMNMAAVWDLPLVFLCQNNAFAECTPLAGYTKTENLADRASGYGMPGETVDGNDPVAVMLAVRAAGDRARTGGGPTFVEAQTYRLQGHYFGDPAAYVDKDELAAAREAEPLGRYRTRLVDAGAASPDELDAIDAEVKAAVTAAFDAARAAAMPGVDELHVDVYADRRDDGTRGGGPPVSIPDGATEDLNLVAAINRTLDRALASNDSVVLLGEDIADPAGGLFKVTAGLSTKHGTDRVRATPIAESAIVGAAIGLSLEGYRPVAELMFMDFLGVAMDQIANHAAKVRYLSGGRQSAPLVIRTPVGMGSGPQHSQALEAWAMHVPGLKVVWPSTPADAVGLLNASLDDDDPVLFVECMKLYFAAGKSPVPVADYTLPIGKADVKREGSDVTIVAYGGAVPNALAAAEALAEEGTSAEVVDLRSLLPLDLDTVVESVGSTRRLVIAHESVGFCGPGGEIAAAVGEELFGRLAAPIRRVTGTFTPVPRAPSLEAACRPTTERIVEAVRGIG